MKKVIMLFSVALMATLMLSNCKNSESDSDSDSEKKSSSGGAAIAAEYVEALCSGDTDAAEKLDMKAEEKIENMSEEEAMEWMEDYIDGFIKAAKKAENCENASELKDMVGMLELTQEALKNPEIMQE